MCEHCWLGVQAAAAAEKKEESESEDEEDSSEEDLQFVVLPSLVVSLQVLPFSGLIRTRTLASTKGGAWSRRNLALCTSMWRHVVAHRNRILTILPSGSTW